MKRSRLLTTTSRLALFLAITLIPLLGACTPANPVMAPLYDPSDSRIPESTNTEDMAPTGTQETSSPSAVSEPANSNTAKLQSPTRLVETPLPVLGSVLNPPREDCFVYQNGRVRFEDLPYVHSGPSPETSVVGRLGNNHWAHGLQMQNGWYEIVVGLGETGWVYQTGVGDNGQCAAEPVENVPMIMNRGAPANYRCVAMRTDFSPLAPPVYDAADTQALVVARLGNWADVRERLADWYEISIPQGGSGWVEASNVELSIGCSPSAHSTP